MPRRTNLFQQVVVIIHGHMAEGATVDESAMLPDRETGDLREVDAAIRQIVAGHPIIVQVEATARGEKADVKWVEQELGKHKALRTNKLVLVSESGFTAGARKKAEHNDAVALAPGDIAGDDPAGRIVNALGTVKPVTFQTTPTDVAVEVELPDESLRTVRVSPDIEVCATDGTNLGAISALLLQWMNANHLVMAEQLGIGEKEEDQESDFEMVIPGFEGVLRQEDGSAKEIKTCLRWQPDPARKPEFHRIVRVKVVGQIHIEVTDVPLTHLKLGDVSLAYGTGKIDGADALFVFTEGKGGGKGTIRLTDGTGRVQSFTSDILDSPATTND